MLRTGSSALALSLAAAACVAAGVVAGLSWARSGPQPALFHGDEAATPSRPPATDTVGLPSFRAVVQRVGPSVVTVRAKLQPGIGEPGIGEPADAASSGLSRPDPRPADRPVVAVGGAGFRNGSGFVVNERGLVLTSRHVVVDATAIEVTVPGHGAVAADLVGEDRATDLALLRLARPLPGVPALAFGASEDLQAGDWIVTVGNPYGFARTVTAGVVSFVGRHLPHSDLEVTGDFLQISAPVHPGSSGCPVVDLHGRVVGVTMQVAAAAPGISFAVPSRSVKWALTAMGRCPDGRVRRGYLGIQFASRPGVDDLGRPRGGAVIVGVATGEPADLAGLRRGDIVLRVDGAPVRDAKQLHERIVCSDPGTPLALQLLREGEIHDPIVAVLGEVGGKPGTGQAN